MPASSGSQRITAAGVIGTSGKPIRVYGFTMRSKDTGPGVVTLYNGIDTTNASPEKYKMEGNQGYSAEKQFNAMGKWFPAGCYVDIDTNVLYVDIDYTQETS